jgi:hypothetical protein
MKSVFCAIFTGALLCVISLAQDATPPPNASPQQAPSRQAPSQEQAAQPQGQQQPNSGNAGRSAPDATGIKRLAPGSVIPVELTKSVDAKKAKTGDEVVAKVTQDMKNNTGEVIVPKDTKVIGHVTESQPRNKEKESQVGIAFDRAVTKNGEMQMPMSIQAIIGPQNNGPNSGTSPAPEESPAGRTAGSSSGQAPGMRGSSAPASPPSSGGSYSPAAAQGGSNSRPPITAETQGVVGMPNLKLESSAQTSNQGSVVTSEKNNVKLDSGTMLLLRVNQ